MIWIQYINKETITINDADIHEFKYLEIKSIPKRLAEYLLYKFPNSFKKSSKPEDIKLNKIMNNFKETIQENILIYFYKKSNEKIFKMLPVDASR